MSQLSSLLLDDLGFFSCNDTANQILVYELQLYLCFNFSLTLKLDLMETSHTSESSQSCVAGGRQGGEGGPGMLRNHKALCNKTTAFCVRLS